ncbi:YbaB/EbfC family nucleoid-associated protein [Streptomyces sp. NPDC002514]|uniref:YbaB/EbfC family nucleoid-associated protein n=1 Tax=Streptomyces sp. NPDC001270 TaxID=3364554 RepID=UPI0036A51AF6
MDTQHGSRLQQALAAFVRKHEALLKAELKLTELSVTAQSRDGAVEATVGVDGETSGLRFPNNRFQGMSGQALADSVMEALTTARAEVSARRAGIVEASGLHLTGGPGHSLGPDRRGLALRTEPGTPPDVLRPPRRRARGVGC